MQQMTTLAIATFVIRVSKQVKHASLSPTEYLRIQGAFIMLCG